MHKKIMKKFFGLKIPVLLFFTVMTACMLGCSGMASGLALEGLNLWFTKMIPALLPFMILSGVLIQTGLSDSFAALFSPLLRPLFQLSDSCLYCIIIGFLCGFPMGARVCAQSLQKGRITRREATLLLAFCNNIGPIYFTGYVLGLFPVQNTLTVLAGMYGIPLLYGLTLRCTLYRDIPAPRAEKARPAPLAAAGISDTAKPWHASKASCAPKALAQNGLTPPELLTQLHAAILSGLDAITVLGGYMIFCNLLNLLPMVFCKAQKRLVSLSGPLLEITSGLSRLSPSDRDWAYIVLPFGGLSCIAQTYSCIKDTDLSLSEYVFHKVVQTMLTAAFYAFFPIV